MDRSPRLVAGSAGVALLLIAAAAAAQLPTAEQSAFDAIDRAGAALNSAGGRFRMVESVAGVVAAAERARNAFAAADRARDAAGQRYEAAVADAASLAVRCDNGYRCGGGGRIDYSDDLVAAYARSIEALSAMLAAQAGYVETVGIAGADAGRERAARLRRFANRMRGLQGGDDEAAQRRNALLDELRIEVDGAGALHSRAVEAHVAANRAALAAIGRAAGMASTAAVRLTDDYYPGTRAAEVLRAADAADRAVSAAAAPGIPEDGDRTDAALDELIFAARETLVVLQSHVELVEQAAREYERDPEPAAPDDLPPDRREPAGDSEPAGDIDGWVRQLQAAVAAVERAAAEAERAASGAGSWFARSNACMHAYQRALQAAFRVQSLTGSRRPAFVPAEASAEVWSRLRDRVDAAADRASDACSSIESPRE